VFVHIRFQSRNVPQVVRCEGIAREDLHEPGEDDRRALSIGGRMPEKDSLVVTDDEEKGIGIANPPG
jgi:hypothetical protein